MQDKRKSNIIENNFGLQEYDEKPDHDKTPAPNKEDDARRGGDNSSNSNNK